MYRKYTIILGTRAELIKMWPLIKELDNRKIDYFLVSTGQQDLSSILKDFSIRNPDYILYNPSNSSLMNSKLKTLGWLFWSKINLIRFFINNKTDYSFVHGDTLSTLFGAFISKMFFFKGIKLVHIEAGLRSKNIFEPFPEEFVRRVVDNISDYLFVTCQSDLDNLYNCMKKKSYVVGNTIVDSIYYAKSEPDYSDFPKKYWLNIRNGDFSLVSIHRYENISNVNRLKTIIECINEASLRELVIWPVHNNTLAKIKSLGLIDSISKNVLITNPLSYFKFVNLESKARFVIADGGSIQEEGIYLKVPVLLMRNYTERQPGLNTKYNFLVGVNKENFIKHLNMIYSGKLAGSEDMVYGKPLVSKKIVDILERKK